MTGPTRSESIRVYSRTINPPREPAGLRRTVARCAGGVVLESLSDAVAATGTVPPPPGPWDRYSIYALDPVQSFAVTEPDVDAIQEMGRRMRPFITPTGDTSLPFVSGWIGYVAYEAGLAIEPAVGPARLPDEVAPPLAHWALYDSVIIHDRQAGTWYVAGTDLPATLRPVGRVPIDKRLDRLQTLVRLADDAGLADRQSAPIAREPSWNAPTSDYLERVRKALDYIAAGDVYQVNLSRRFSALTDAPPEQLYHRLCHENPASFSAFLKFERNATGQARVPATPPPGANESIVQGGEIAVLSSSPELFLDLYGRTVTTRPIKGTRPRVGDPLRDAAAARDLAESPKDRAELNMIVDLERNDLGRVCEFGSVRVLSAGAIETCPTVLHRTATVVGRLRADLDAVDLLRATFPGGSVTGAPKVRAMQIIRELEPFPRGVYCGAIGFIGLDGRMRLNLAIRTMTVLPCASSAGQDLANRAARRRVTLHVGSGIVADSDPILEAQELEAKAAGMIAALGLGDAAADLPGTPDDAQLDDWWLTGDPAKNVSVAP